MAINGAKEMLRCFGSGPATFQLPTITTDIISHGLFSFSENFSHDLKGCKFLKIWKVSCGITNVSPKICKRHSLAVFLKTNNPFIFRSTQIQSLVVYIVILPSNSTHCNQALESHLEYYKMFLNGSLLDLIMKEYISCKHESEALVLKIKC